MHYGIFIKQFHMKLFRLTASVTQTHALPPSVIRNYIAEWTVLKDCPLKYKREV